jgi:LacI family transcriptional regulator
MPLKMNRTRLGKKVVTLGDVAKAAGVAPMTVSRYLNNHPNVTEATSRKVAIAIKRLGYSPNVAARMLMGQPSETIGLIVPTLADAFFAEVAHNVQLSARQVGKLVWVASSDSDVAIERALILQMKQHQVDGVLLVPAAKESSDDLQLGDLPVVALDRPFKLQSCAVVADNRGGAAALVEHLIMHRYRQILCLSTDLPSIYTIGERIAGYEDVMRRHHLKPLSLFASQGQHQFREAVRKALRSTRPPRAIFCTNNVTTIQLLEVLLADGVRIPEEVAVAGFDDFELAPYMRPGVTVVRQPAAELGREAAKALFTRIQDKNLPGSNRKISLPTSLIIRESCGCAPTKID